jgi:MFS family permease
MDSGASSGGRSKLRVALRSVTTAWFFGAVWLYVVTGAALTRYGKLLGLSDANFGLLAAVPFAGALIQFPLSYLVEKYGGHKPIFIVVGMIHRGMWLFIALIPWILPETHWWKGLLVLSLLSSLAGNITLPIWVAWMADLVPSAIRGRYFSRRNQIGQFVGLAATLAVGWALDAAEPAGNDLLLRLIALMLGVAAVCGMTDFTFFLRVPPPGNWRPNPNVGIMHLIAGPLRNKNLMKLIGFQATFAFGTGYVGQYVWLFMFDEAKVSNSRANLLLVVIPIIIMMLAFPVWGRLIDRFGRKPILIIAALLIVHGAVPWIFVRGEYWWIGYATLLVATVAWPGLDLSLFNLLLGISESERSRGCGTSCIALSSVFVSVAGVMSGVFAGAVASALGSWHGSLFGWPLSYHGLLFMVSAVIRLASVLWIVRLEDPGATSTQVTFEYITQATYTNMVAAAVLPVRFLMGIGRWTYRLTPGPMIMRHVKRIMKTGGQ